MSKKQDIKEIKQNVSGIREELKQNIKELKEEIANSKSSLEDYSLALTGISDAFEGLSGTVKVTKDIMKDGMNLENTLNSLSSSINSVVGAAEIGTAICPGIGTAAGAAVGGVASLVTTMMSWNEILNNLPTASGKLLESMNELEMQKQESLKTGFSELELNAHLVTGLEDLIDSNGMVMEGYENRATLILEKLNEAFGTEYELVGNQIVQNGEAITSYENMKQSVEEMVTQKKLQLAMQVFEEDYVETLKKQKEIQDEINKRTGIANLHMEWYQNALKGVGETGGYSLKELEKGLENDKKQLDELNGALESNSNDLEEYSNIFSAYASGNTEEIENVMNDYGISLNTSMTDTENELDTFKGKIEETGKALNQELEKKRTCTFSVNTIVNGISNFGNNLAKGIGSLFGFKEEGGIYSNGSWKNIPQYANGGLPNHGTMFIAGESGAEIVGHINGRTEVLNKSQIASAIYTAVATAMSEYSRTNQDIRVYAEEGLIVEKVSKGINQHVKQTGNLPFTIPI